MSLQWKDCTKEIALELNSWLTDETTKKYAMFDSKFDEEFEFYQSNSYEEQIKDVLKVVYVDDILMGYVVLNYYAYDGIREVGINPLIIHPAYRNQDYGYQILSHLVEHIEEFIGDCVNQIYAAIDQTNLKSISLFERVGFRYSTMNDNFRNYYIHRS